MKNFKEYRRIKSELGLITEQQFISDKGPENLEVELVGSDQKQIVQPINIPLSPVKLKKPSEMGAGINIGEEPELIEEPQSEVTQDSLITKIVNAHLQLRILHWGTEEYSMHMATGGTYELLDEILDKFVESYQGYFPRTQFCDCFNIRNISDLVIEEWICSVESDIDSLRSMCPQTDLQNILDEIKGLFGKLKYLLTLK